MTARAPRGYAPGVETVRSRLNGPIHIRPKVHGDRRGYFMESFVGPRYRELGIDANFVMDGESLSRKGTVRGLHFRDPGEAKLVRCVMGAIWDVVVDMRVESPTYGQWEGFELSEENHAQLYIPVGFAHGFSVLSEAALMLYKKTEVYDAVAEKGIAWNDPAIAIDWKVEVTTLSDRDQKHPTLAQWTASRRA